MLRRRIRMLCSKNHAISVIECLILMVVRMFLVYREKSKNSSLANPYDFGMGMEIVKNILNEGELESQNFELIETSFSTEKPGRTKGVLGSC
ncbi:hypothetical protein VNO77_05456 [Canavalia gladiata]|uniref:Uncharacterized protein n=1 Tax=Canavalia gladiata TaxID=3824 RepID=A0AAN9R8N8_CANGL